MTRIPLLLAITALAIAGTAIAQDATLPEVKARQDLMQAQRAAAAALGDMAAGRAAFDAAAAARARADLAALAAAIPAAFEPAVTEAASEARPAIWTDWEDFVARAEALTAAAQALDATSLDGVRAGMAAVGAACKACHQTYRM
jgi:cytochrome c556